MGFHQQWYKTGIASLGGHPTLGHVSTHVHATFPVNSSSVSVSFLAPSPACVLALISSEQNAVFLNVYAMLSEKPRPLRNKNAMYR